jgi:phosphomannomutase
VPLCLLLAAQQQGGSIAKLLKTLPERYTYSDRIKEFPTELSQSILAEIQTGQLTQDATVFAQLFFFYSLFSTHLYQNQIRCLKGMLIFPAMHMLYT